MFGRAKIDLDLHHAKVVCLPFLTLVIYFRSSFHFRSFWRSNRLEAIATFHQLCSHLIHFELTDKLYQNFLPCTLRKLAYNNFLLFPDSNRGKCSCLISSLLFFCGLSMLLDTKGLFLSPNQFLYAIHASLNFVLFLLSGNCSCL